MRKIKRIAKFEGLEPQRCEDIKGIVVPDIGPKSFGTFEKQAPGTELRWFVSRQAWENALKPFFCSNCSSVEAKSLCVCLLLHEAMLRV